MKLLNKAINKYQKIPIAARATLWFVFCSTLQKGISLITTPIFTRIMSTEQYGQFTVYNSWLQIITIITTLRLDYAVFNKGMSKYKDDRDMYTSTMQSLTFIITLVVFLIYLIFHNAINKLIELPTFIMVAMFCELLVFPAVNFWTIRKRYEYIYRSVVIRTVLMVFINAAVGVTAVLLADEKGYARILSSIAVNATFGIVLFTYNAKKGKRLFEWKYAKFAILFNLPLLLHYCSQYVLDQFDKIMIQKMIDMSAAGIYGVAYSAGLIMKIVTQSVNNALIPWQYDKLEKKEFKSLDKNITIIFLFIGCCSLLFSAFAPELIKILADEKYYEAIYVIPPVALGMFFSFAYTTFANVELFFNRNRFTMYISMSGALLNIILNYICIQKFGYIAAAYTTLFCYVFFAVAHYIYTVVSVKKVLGVCSIFNTAGLLMIGVAVLVGGLLIILLYDKPLIRYTILGAAAICCLIFRKNIITFAKSIKSAKKM